MATEVEELDLVVLGIDEGSSGTGAVFGYKAHDVRGLTINKHDEQVRLDGDATYNGTSKTPSAILYKDDDTGGFVPDCFGDEAVFQRHRRSDRYYVEGFKRQLHDTSCLWIKVVSPRQALKDHMAAVMRAAFRQLKIKNLHERHLRTVMTMPSGTSSGVFKTMLVAAQEAICAASPYHDENPERFNVLFLTEPTAVMLQTFFQSAQTQNVPKGVISIYDLGGGTSDICYYTLTTNAKKMWEANEMVKEQGILSGGIKIDEAFFSAVERRNPEAWKSFKEEIEHNGAAQNAYEWLWEKWLRAKRVYKEGPIWINLPRALYHRMHQETIEIEELEARAIFDFALDPILEAIERNPGDHPYITGGLAKSPYCQKRIRELIPNVKIVEGEDMAVCKGALIYAWDSHLIASRVLQRSYGVIYDQFIDNLPDYKAEYARQIRPLKIFNPVTVDLELFTRAVRLCANIGDKVDTSQWYKIHTLLPSKIADKTITIDLVGFDKKITNVNFHKTRGIHGENQVLLIPELPRGIPVKFTYTAEIPEELRQQLGTKIDVYTQFRADGVRLQLNVTNQRVPGEREPETYTVAMSGGT